MEAKVATVRSKHIELTALAKLSEITAALKKFEIENKGKKFVITMNGTFPVAKVRSLEGKKSFVEGGVTLKNQPLVDLGSKWIEYINDQNRRSYVKTERATDVTFRIVEVRHTPTEIEELQEAADAVEQERQAAEEIQPVEEVEVVEALEKELSV